DGIRDRNVTGVQTCALPIWSVVEPYLVPTIRTRISALSSTALRQLSRVPASGLIGKLPYSDRTASCPRLSRNCFISALTCFRSRSEERRVGKECRSLCAE